MLKRQRRHPAATDTQDYGGLRSLRLYRRNKEREREITMSETHGKFIWCELMTPDTGAAVDFYGKVVGWTTTQMSVPGMPPYTIFEANGVGVAGLMEFPAELEGKGIPPNWTG